MFGYYKMIYNMIYAHLLHLMTHDLTFMHNFFLIPAYFVI
jgi:hypothetical protein